MLRWSSKKFPSVVLSAQVALIVVYALCVRYHADADAAAAKPWKDKRNSVQDFYPMFQDVNTMIFLGFGFLMTFLKKYGYSAVGLNILLAALSIQWAVVMQGVWTAEDGKISFGIVSLVNGCFASATVLISYGALLGKVSPLQLVAMTAVEIAVFACNEHLGVGVFQAADIGGSIFLHTFGAYFGLAVSRVLYRKEWASPNDKEGAVYHSDLFAMIGTVFLWMFWPSFNSVMAEGDEQHRSVVNTYVALLASCVVTFGLSALTEGEGKLNMVHVQNATLAGGVAIGSTANMMMHPFGALIVGAAAAVVSTLGYKILTPFLLRKLNMHDTCGVNNLHGMPGIMAGLLSAVIAAIADEHEYGFSLYKLYPARSPHLNSTDFGRLHAHWKDLSPGEGWSAGTQALAQVKALLSTIAVAVTAGIATGYLLSHPVFEQPEEVQLFDDHDFWEVPQDERDKA